MRDQIKQILIQYKEHGILPPECKLQGFSGGFRIYNTEDSWANWEAVGSSAQWDKMTYKVYNVYNQANVLEQGILLIGKYNK
jgi:hypothetical protein